MMQKNNDTIVKKVIHYRRLRKLGICLMILSPIIFVLVFVLLGMYYCFITGANFI